ncbi:MAG: epoxyqueuosine reductase [Desulfatitalea sp.]|nr:epoxyqueuosine reductase [Desulfatitalea sp.]MBI5895610.1 epoxyqueuosine reductase [Desulfobacterales bacterium]
MLTKEDLIENAHANGFADIGFTSAEPFESHRQFLEAHQAEYGWVETMGLALVRGTDPKSIMPQAQTIIVLMESYYRQAFPKFLEGHFGRCYLDDDRISKDGLALRVKALRGYLSDHGIQSKVPLNLPHRMAAARAGLGTFGKNCLFYSRKAARQGSWVLPITLLVDRAFEPDTPTIAKGCPTWCRNACIAACPTRALKGDGTIDPRRCISFLSYYGDGLTPRELREPMGLYIYGCDRCQNVCPRNAPWLAADLPANPKAAVMQADFRLERLLAMDKAYFESRVWPRMFYMPAEQIWRWKMNVARAMGNTRDPRYIDALVDATAGPEDERVHAMAAWALGRIGGLNARAALEKLRQDATAAVREEAEAALGDLK